MKLIIKKENLAIEYEPRDTMQPYRVVNKDNLIKTQNNEPEIIYFCETEEKAQDVINNLDKYLRRD